MGLAHLAYKYIQDHVLVSSWLPSSTRYGAEGPYQSGTRRSRELTVLVHGHTENSLLYHPLTDKMEGH